MQIVKIDTDEYTGREVAYMFDQDSQKVLKVFVDDYTSNVKRQARSEEPSYKEVASRYEQREPVESVRRPALRRPKPIVFEDEEEGTEDTGDPNKLPGPLMDLPVKPKSIVPPHMRGLMVEHETPGSDVMTRKG